MLSPVPGPLFHFVPPVFFLQRESLQSFLLFLICFYSSQLFVLPVPSNSSEWNSQVLVSAPGSSLMLCSIRRTPFRVSLHPAARRRNFLLLWSSDADLRSEVIKAFPHFPPRLCGSQVRSLFSSAVMEDVMMINICKLVHKYADNSALFSAHNH